MGKLEGCSAYKCAIQRLISISALFSSQPDNSLHCEISK